MPLQEQNLKCDECGKDFTGIRIMHRDPEKSYRILCDECLGGFENSAKRNFLKERRDGKALEERVSWLEEWVYDQIEHLIRFNAEVKDMEQERNKK
jgi:hypothetical protein